jgi:hypothetical protein
MRNRAALEATAALLVGLVLVTLGATVTDPGDTQPDFRTSSYVNDVEGARALHEVLRGCGLRPERLLEPVASLPDHDRSLVVAAPSEPFTDAHVDELYDWAAAGGRVVIVAAKSAPPLRASFHSKLFARLGLRARDRSMGRRAAEIQDDAGIDPSSELSWPAVQVLDDIPGGAAADERAGERRVLVATRSHELAVTVPFGEQGGEVVVLADDAILTNEHLREADNAVFVVQLLTARERDDGRVVFDEYHHGFRPEGEREGLYAQAAAMLWTTWPGRGILVLFGAWLVLLAGRAVRLGAPLPDAPPPRRRLSEHADALGRLLEKARARTEVLHILTAGTRRVVGPRAGLPPGLSPAGFRDRLAASPAPGAEELAQALDEAERLQPTREAEVARAARRLAKARRDYLHGDVHRGS